MVNPKVYLCNLTAFGNFLDMSNQGFTETVIDLTDHS